MPADDHPTRLALVQHLVTSLGNALQGANVTSLHEDRPKNVYPCGALHPPQEDQPVDELEAEFGATEYKPSALGFTFQVPEIETLNVDISASLRLFYPVHPDHSEVISFCDKFAPGDTIVKMPPKYKPLDVVLPPTRETIRITPTDGFVPLPASTQAFTRALARAKSTAENDPALYGVAPREHRSQTRTYEASELRDAQWWANRVQSCTRRCDPSWSGRILHRVRPSEDGYVVEVLICNETHTRDSALEDAFIGVQLQASGPSGTLIPTRLPEVEARDYRHDPTSQASGRNCDVIVEFSDGRWRIQTDSIPVYVQNRLVPQHWTDERGQRIFLKFGTLSTPTGIPSLEALAGAMRRYLAEWDEKVAAGAPAARDEPEQARAGREAFEKEVDRFEHGLTILRDPSNKDLLTAFYLMNRTFHRRFRHIEKPDAEWRLFQIVFLVSELPEILARANGDQSHVDKPTVLWFPTGGGKTEAYLGLVILHAFWDRLRGKPFGVTAIAKFPLRMLSLQQFSRVVEIIEHAEDVRLTAPELKGSDGDPFSVGYYAGGGNTLNLLDFPVAPDRAARPSGWTKGFTKVRQNPTRLAAEEKRHRKVANCPSCHDANGQPGKIKTTFDESKPGFRHQCQNPTCKRTLNLHATDTEVLRRLPTFIIATIDKLARLAVEPWGRAIFGEAAAVCEQHGYLYTRPHDASGSPLEHCAILGCGRQLRATPPNADPVPALLIQDELHLLTESLGAFASHYETMLAETARRVGRDKRAGAGPWHVIGSTATIEGYRYLVRQLYNRSDPVRFPQPGPTRAESFYARESDEPQRIVVGVRPHGMTHVDTVMKVLLEYHRTLWPLVDPSGVPAGAPLPPPLAGISPTDARTLARRYRTSLTYGINRNEVAQVNNSFVGQLNLILAREGYSGFDPARVPNLTGDSDIENVQQFLDQMERDVPDSEYPQAVTATSIISHGVDLDDLNFMVFRGMPHRMAEYIQAMSRVGRKEGVPALVVNVYNPNRERDASHFEAHKAYLRLREILIRNIPTTRFSAQALEKTIQGLVLHYVNYNEPPLDLWKKTTVDGLLREITARKDEFVEAVRAELGLLDAPDPNSPFVKRQAELADKLVARIRTDLQRFASDPSDSNYASDRLGALQSLRDTDVQIPVFSGGSLEEA